MFNLIVISIQDCIEFFLIKCTSFFSSLFFSYVSKRFCTCIRSYLQTKSYFHTYSYTQPVVLIVVVVIVVSMLFSFSIQTKKWSKRECKRRSWKLGSFLLLHLVLYAPTTQRWLNWFHECPSFSPEWIWWKEHILLLTRSYSSERSSCNRFLLTWIHFQ